MKKPLLITTVLASLLVLVGAGVWFVRSQSDNALDSTVSTSEDSRVIMPENDNAMDVATADPAPSSADPSMLPAQESSPQPTTPPAVSQPPQSLSRFIDLSEFNTNKSTYDSVKKVYFFHAPWCPICKAIEEDILGNPNQIPEGTVFIKTDYESSTPLRQKYGVTYQYTFVQVDNNGNEQKQWSATNLDKAIAGIQ